MHDYDPLRKMKWLSNCIVTIFLITLAPFKRGLNQKKIWVAAGCHLISCSIGDMYFKLCSLLQKAQSKVSASISRNENRFRRCLKPKLCDWIRRTKKINEKQWI
jgi:hypothetical protein